MTASAQRRRQFSSYDNEERVAVIGGQSSAKTKCALMNGLDRWPAKLVQDNEACIILCKVDCCMRTAVGMVAVAAIGIECRDRSTPIQGRIAFHGYAPSPG